MEKEIDLPDLSVYFPTSQPENTAPVDSPIASRTLGAPISESSSDNIDSTDLQPAKYVSSEIVSKISAPEETNNLVASPPVTSKSSPSTPIGSNLSIDPGPSSTIDEEPAPPLTRQNAFYCPNPQKLSYHSKVPREYIFYEGKIEYKKRKAPANPQPSMLVGKEYRKYMVDKKEKGRKKKKGDEWWCIYCHINWNDDVNNNEGKKWIECDGCQRQMHTSCVPRKHKNLVNYDSGDSEEEVNFECEFCTSES